MYYFLCILEVSSNIWSLAHRSISNAGYGELLYIGTVMNHTLYVSSSGCPRALDG